MKMNAKLPRGDPGGTPLNKLDMYVRRKGVGFSSRFGLSYGIDLCVEDWNNITMELGMVFIS